MSFRSVGGAARRTSRLVVGLAGIVGLAMMVSTSAHAATASASDVSKAWLKGDSQPMAVFAVTLTNATAHQTETLTRATVRLSSVNSFNRADIAADVTAAGCPEATGAAASAWCDGFSFWRDNGNGVLDKGDTPVFNQFTVAAVNPLVPADCTSSDGPCDVTFNLNGSDAAEQLPDTSSAPNYLIAVRTSANCDCNGHRFTLGLTAGNSTFVTTGGALPTTCGSGCSITSQAVTLDNAAPSAPTISGLGLSKVAGIVHVSSPAFTGEPAGAVLQVYSSLSDTCSSPAFVAESSPSDAQTDYSTLTHRDLPGMSAAALQGFPVGSYVCYRVKDRALNLSPFVSDGVVPAAPTAANLTELYTSNVSGAKQIDTNQGATGQFRLYVKPGNTGSFVRVKDQSATVNDQWVDIHVGDTCSKTPDQTQTMVCTTDVQRYVDGSNTPGATLASTDGIGYAVVNGNGNDGPVAADGVIPAAPDTTVLNLLSVSAANGHQRLLHAGGGSAGSVYGLYVDTDGAGPGAFARGVDSNGTFVTVTAGTAPADSGTGSITAGGVAMAAGDNVGYVGVSPEGNISGITADTAALPSAPAAADTTFSNALGSFLWKPPAQSPNTAVRLYAGASRDAAYNAGVDGTAATGGTPVTVGTQAAGSQLWYTLVDTSTGNESSLVQDGTVPAAPSAGDVNLLSASAATNNQRTTVTADAAGPRTFRLYIDPAGATAWKRSSTLSNGTTPVEVTSSTTQSASSASVSIFAGATQLQALNAVGYAIVDGNGNDSTVAADGLIPAKPDATLGHVSDAADRFFYSAVTSAISARLYLTSYKTAGPDATATAANQPAGAAISSGNHSGSSVIYSVLDVASGNESDTTTDGTVPAPPVNNDMTLLSLTAAQGNQRISAVVDASSRTFRLFVDKAGGSNYTQAVDGALNPVQIVTSTGQGVTGTTTAIFAGDGTPLAASWSVAYALVDGNGNDSDTLNDGTVPINTIVTDTSATAATSSKMKVNNFSAHYGTQTVRLYTSQTNNAATAFSHGVQATATSTNTNPSTSAALNGGDYLYYSVFDPASGNEGLLAGDRSIPQPVDRTLTEASAARNEFVVPGASATNIVHIIVSSAPDMPSAYTSNDLPAAEQDATASPWTVTDGDIKAENIYYTVRDSATAGDFNESPMIDDGSVPGKPDDAMGIMGASAATQTITSSADSTPGRTLRLYVNAGSGYQRATSVPNGSSYVAVQTTGADVTSSPGIYAGQTPLSPGQSVAYSRVFGGNESALSTDGVVPNAPLTDDFTANAQSGQSAIGAPAISGVYRVFGNGAPVSPGITHSSGTANSITYTSALHGGDAVGYAMANSNGNESPVFADGVIPSAGTPSLQAASDTGFSATDGITKVTSPAFDVATVNGASVSLLEGATTLGSATASGTSVAVTSSALSEGTHSIASQATLAGNTSPVSSVRSVTIDLTAPASPAAAPVLQAASDSGSSSTDRVTKVTTPAFDVTGTPNGVVTLKEGSTSLGTALTNGSGAGAVSSSALGDGLHTVVATTTDAAGNESGVSPSAGVTIDTVAPAIPTGLSLQAASDSGASHSDRVTNVTTPSLDVGESDGSATVTLVDGAASLVTASSGSGGGVTLTVPAGKALADGLHTLAATATDVAGNVSAASSSLGVIVDTVAPAKPSAPDLTDVSDSGASHADNLTNVTAPSFTLSGAEVAALATLKDGDTATGSSVVDGGGAATLVSGAIAGDGNHAFTVTLTDTAGNVSAVSDALTLVLDTTAPATPASAPDLKASSDSGSSSSDDVTKVATPSFDVTGVEPSSLAGLAADGVAAGSAPADSLGSASVDSVTLGDGVHAITVAVTDAAGNVSGASPALSVTIDTIAPATPAELALQAGSDSGSSNSDRITNVTTPAFGVTEADGAVTLALSDGTTAVATATSGSGGAATIAVPQSAALSDGNHTFSVNATDVAGNASAASGTIDVTVDTVAPAKPSAPDLTDASDSGVSHSDDLTNVTTPSFTVAGAEAGGVATLLDGTAQAASSTVASDGTATLDAGSIAGDGNHAFSVKAADVAGNLSAASDALTVVLDTTAPSAPAAPDLLEVSDTGRSQTDDLTKVTTPSFGALGVEPGALVTLAADGVDAGFAPANGAGSATVDSVTLGEGTHQMTFALTDAAGNVSAVSSVHGITIDTTAPTATVTVASSLLGGSRVTFSEDVASVDGSQLVLRVAGTATNVDASVGYTGSSKIATITPRAALVPGQRYDVVVAPSGSTAPSDAAGNGAASATGSFRASQVEEEGSLALHEAWSTVGDRRAMGGWYATDHLAGSRATMAFSGKAVTWYTMTGPDQGDAYVTIDGRNVGHFQNWASSVRFGVARTFSGLSSGSHVISVIVGGNRGSSRATDTKVVVDAFKITWPNGSTATLASPPLSYMWRLVTASGASGGRYKVADRAGNAFAFGFRGTRVTWVPVFGPSMGRALVQIDGVGKGTFDLYSPYTQYGIARAFAGLTDGPHTIRVVATGTHRPASSGNTITIDKLIVG